MSDDVAYLAHGKLHLSSGGTVRDFDSTFGESVKERARSIQRRHGWKSAGRGASFMGSRLLWGGESEDDPAGLRIAVTDVGSGAEPGSLLFVLNAGGLDGVFSLRLADLFETRLLHGSDRGISHLAISPSRTRVACSVTQPDGSASLAVMKPDATDLTEITEGDAVDLAPAWKPGSDRDLVYQSAGIGRDRNGTPSGLGPFVVHTLNVESGEIGTLADDAKSDFLQPRLLADGTLLAIRRPYKSGEHGSPFRTLGDFLLFPFRLVYAIFQYLNFFSTRYTGKPLTTAGGPKKQAADLKQMMIWGNLIDADAEAKKNAKTSGEPPAIVPRSWELVSRGVDGKLSVLERSVLSFDVAPDGSVFYSTGSAIYKRSPSGETRRLLSATGIEKVVSI